MVTLKVFANIVRTGNASSWSDNTKNNTDIKIGRYVFKPNETKYKTYYSSHYPECKHCQFYIKNESSESLGKCKKFGRVSKNTKVDYEFTEFCREQIDLCGPPGVYFELRDRIDFIE
jgi:hypothetical protein